MKIRYMLVVERRAFTSKKSNYKYLYKFDIVAVRLDYEIL